MVDEVTIDFVEDGTLRLSPNTSHQYAFPEEFYCETGIGVRYPNIRGKETFS